MVKTLKAVAEDLGAPILLVSTFGRRIDERPDKRPGLSDITPRWKGKSREIVAPYVDTVMFTYRDGLLTNPLFNQGQTTLLDTDAAGSEITEVIVAKARRGATGAVNLRFDEHRGGFI